MSLSKERELTMGVPEENEITVEQELTDEQRHEIAQRFGVSEKDKSPVEIEQEIENAILESEQGKEIQEKSPGLLTKLGKNKLLKVATVVISMLAAELPASQIAFGQDKKIEQKEIQKYDFSEFTEMWKEWKADKDRDKKDWSKSDWEKWAIEHIKLRQEMGKMFAFIAQDEEFQKSGSYQDFLKEYPKGFSLNENNYLMDDLSGIGAGVDEAGGRGLGAYKTEASGGGYSIVYWTAKNITQQTGGRLYHVPEQRYYQIKLAVDGQDVFIGGWRSQPQGRTLK